jgi:hypothetical protein
LGISNGCKSNGFNFSLAFLGCIDFFKTFKWFNDQDILDGFGWGFNEISEGVEPWIMLSILHE